MTEMSLILILAICRNFQETMTRPTPLYRLLPLSLLWLLSCMSSWLPSSDGQFLLGTFTHPESYTPQRRIPLFPGQLTSVQSKIYRSLHSGAGWRTPSSHFPPAGVLSHRMGIFDEFRNSKKGLSFYFWYCYYWRKETLHLDTKGSCSSYVSEKNISRRSSGSNVWRIFRWRNSI